MSLTLDATLATSQNSQSRHPICEIISAQNTDDIPFDGERLTASTEYEKNVHVILHSSGRLCGAYVYQVGNTKGIKYICSDTDRVEISSATRQLFTTSAYGLSSVSICELTNGNLGIIYLYTYSSKYYIASYIVDVSGTYITSSAKEIANWATSVATTYPLVYTIGSNSYIMIYGKQSGANYYVYKRTSSDFLTWSSESSLSIGGIDTTLPLHSQSLIKLIDGNYWLWFSVRDSVSPDGSSTLYNLYYSVSADGVTWGDAVKFTGYTALGTAGVEGRAVQKTEKSMHVVFREVLNKLFMNSTFTNWPTTSYSNHVAEVSWDAVNRKLYIISYRSNAGVDRHAFVCVVQVDVDTWTATKYWNSATVPAFDSRLVTPYDVKRCGSYAVHDGHNIVVYRVRTGTTDPLRIVELLDAEADTIRSWDLTPTTGNVSGVPNSSWTMGQPYVDIEHDKIWLSFSYQTGTYRFAIGYIDLTEVSDYAWHSFYTSPGVALATAQAMDSDYPACGGYYLDYTNNLIVITSGNAVNNRGVSAAIDLSSGGAIYFNERSTYFYTPPVVYNGKVYCGKGTYVNPYYYITKLLEIDLETGEEFEIDLFYASSGVANTMISRPVYVSGDKIAFNHFPYGIILFDVVTREYEIFSNATVPNLTNDKVNPHWMSQIAYDETNEMILFGHPAPQDGSVTAPGLYAVPISGFIAQTQYSIGTYNEGLGTWSFTTPDAIVRGYREYYACPVATTGDEAVIYLFWVTLEYTLGAITGYSIKWGIDNSETEFTQYITGEVVTEHNINGDPARLTFSMAEGHLFDPYNLTSLLHIMCEKGRKITLRWGEEVASVNYWQNAGTFYIIETSLSFERGKYPIITIVAEDKRCFWNTGHIYTTSIYEQQTPKTVIDGILASQGDLESGERNIPALSTSLINYQGMETTLSEMLDHICGRFGYYFRFDVDGKAHAKQISNALTVNHTYTDNTKLLNYTPDDRFSDFTNRVTVRGQSLDFIEVTFDEERITAITGTLGWWGCKEDHIVWFSEDKSRRVTNPRMVIIETATSIAFELAGSVQEYLEVCGEGDDNKFCTIYVSAPNLIPALVSGIALYLAGAIIGDVVVTVGFIASGGITVPVGRAMEAAALLIIVNILGAVANYNLEVWGQPLGQIRQSYQASADDETLQYKIGQVIEQVIEEALCYTVYDCLEVANFELMVAQMQRKRVRVKKIAHLQDEDGDTIRVIHPYGGQSIDLFITNLRRSFKRGNDGYFHDEIEGWIC